MNRRLLLCVPALLLSGLCIPLLAQRDPPELPVLAAGGKLRQPIRPGGPPTLADANITDEDALKKADLAGADGPKLLEYLKTRTLTDVDQGKISAIIKRFGADDFDDRLKATAEIEAFGSAAIGPLKKITTERDSDPEMAYRARLALGKMEKVPHAAVAVAVVRAVVKSKPEGAAAALIGFLPLADTDAVAEVIREGLIALAVKEGKAEPAIVAAMTDVSPIRRAAAYVALTEGGGTDGVRGPVKDALPKLKEAVLKDADTEAKFTGLWSLALITREKEYVTELIKLIPTAGRGRIWQLEELLLQFAGTHPKDGRFLKSPESLVKTRDAWLGWWKDKGDKVDFVKFEYKPRLLGLTDVIEMDYRGYNQGRVVSLGPDLKEKWRITGTGVNSPSDVKVASNGNIWISDQNSNTITERTPAGKPLITRNMPAQPVNFDLLPNGGMVVVCRNMVYEFDKDGKQVWVSAQRPNHDIVGGRRLSNGETIYVTNIYQNPNPGQPQAQNCFRLDAKGGDAKKNITVGQVQNLAGLSESGEDKILVCEQNNQTARQRVVEYDLAPTKDGKTPPKEIWKYDCPQNAAPTSCQRLPNGNTLITLMNVNQVIEVDPSGEIVWEYQAKDGLKVGRAYRR